MKNLELRKSLIKQIIEETKNFGVTDYEVVVNQKKFIVYSKMIDGHTIKNLVNSPDNYSVVCQTKSKDCMVGNDEMVDISQPDRNTFFTFNPATVEG